ncbi:MAG TPA: glycosyltransferase family 2 protein [Bryobacteraceae bacterium]|jgi:hypothetical protein|nr:glycosyltransferase family 2 protein [Bryobacteraceae bacterium]
MACLSSTKESAVPPDVSIVLVSYNTRHLLKRVLTAIEEGKGELQIQVIVVDNASRDCSAEFLRNDFPNVELLQNSVNVGFGRANNQALSRVRGRYVLLLNTDAFVSSDTLPKSVKFMDEHKSCGVLGVKLIGEDGSLKLSCCYFPTPWNLALQMTRLGKFFPNIRLIDDMSWDHGSLRSCDWVPGCYYMMRRDVIKTVGLFDPRYFLYWEEVDHCRRVREAGWDVIYYPYTHVVHIGFQSGETFDADRRQIPALFTESLLLYLRKHHGWLGMLALAFLMILYDLASAAKRTIGQDVTIAQQRLKHARLVLRVLRKTRLASRPTL